MTPEGHPWAAIITFSADEVDDDVTAVMIQLMVRANDPLYEVSFKLYTSRLEDKIWTHTLTQLAGHFGSDAPVEMAVNLIDKRRQWKQFGKIWKNSAIRTLLRRDRHVNARREAGTATPVPEEHPGEISKEESL
jgi:hypothetical protein